MDAATLREAMEPTPLYDADMAAYVPHFEAAMRAAEISTVRRGAAWYSQLGHESLGLRYMAEIQQNGPGWSDDRRIYRGRGPIQLTWQGNYRRFGQWCEQQGYTDDEELFVKQPTLVEEPRWGFLAASWYWLHGGPRAGRINEYADAADVLAVSYCVNGWRAPKPPNGYEDRKARWQRCLELGDRLLPNTSQEVPPMPAAVTGDPLWLPEVLKPLGNRLRIMPGWEHRGHGDFKDIRGIMLHHTGNGRASAESIRDGRPDLPGPLSTFHVSRDGILTLIAAGVSWHAGVGSLPWVPANMGNWHLLGFEMAWPMDTSITVGTQMREPWPDAQLDVVYDACALILPRLQLGADRVTTHKEYAGRAQGKWDPGNYNPDGGRHEVAKRLANGINGDGVIIPTPPPVPAPVPPPGGYAEILLHRGMNGLPVVKLQTALRDRMFSKLTVDGDFGPATEAAVKAFQGSKYRQPPLVADGVVGPATAAQLGLVI